MSGVLSVSANGRYLLRDGAPFRIQGDTAWEIVNELDSAEVDTYLADRQAKGFNALIVQVTNSVKYTPSSYAPGAKGVAGAKPWLLNISGGAWSGTFANHDAAFSSPNNVYWDWVDYVISRCAAFGIVVIADFMYMGFNFGAEDGWWQDLSNAGNTQAVCFAFGQYLGNRWKNHPNLILDLGTDMFPTSASESSARMLKILDGLQNAGCTQLVSAHYKRSSDALDYADYASRITFNSVYPSIGGTTWAPNTARCRTAYARSTPMPCVSVENKYESDGEFPGFNFTRVQIRSLGWWGMLTSIAGYVFGNDVIWTFDTGWQAAMGHVGSTDMARMGTFFDARPWYTLVPDGLGSIGTLVTAGGGTPQTLNAVGSGGDGTNGTDYVAAAANPAGTLLVAYVPTAHTGSVTINMTKLSGIVTAIWYDPTNGSTQSIGTYPNTGTRAFTIPGANNGGDNDWVLVLTSPDSGVPMVFGFWAP